MRARRPRGRHWLLVPLLGVFLATRMYMVFASGYPQPADIALMLATAFLLRPRDVDWMRRHFPAFLGVVIWAVVVNGTWSVLRGNGGYALPMAYYVYNFVLVTFVATTRAQYRAALDRVLGWGVVAGAAGQLGLILSVGATSRASGSFNNPNQLGFWSICMMAVYILVRRPHQLQRDLLIIPALAYCQFVTTSRAGVLGFLLLIAIWLHQVTSRSRHRRLAMLVFGAMLLSAPALPAAATYLGNLEMVGRFEARFNKSNAVDEVGLRNTDRITKYPQYTILGAGEGDLARFPHSLPIEIHSTPGTILFSYGIPGSLLFLAFLIGVLRQLTWPQRGVAAALFLYSITHNGLRFPFFWFTMAVLLSESHYNRSRQRATRSRASRDENPALPRTSMQAAASPSAR